jgi:uncharacterized protein YkwD
MRAGAGAGRAARRGAGAGRVVRRWAGAGAGAGRAARRGEAAGPVTRRGEAAGPVTRRGAAAGGAARHGHGVRAQLLLVLVCAGCTIPLGDPTIRPSARLVLPPADGVAPPGDVVPAAGPYAALAGQVLEEINRVRAAADVGMLAADPRLDQAAVEHARELAGRRLLDHESMRPERRTIMLRVETAGVPWRSVAENLAQVPGSPGGVARQTARAWLDSPGHRQSMLDARYTLTGVGVAEDAAGYWYVVQLYVLPAAARE